MGERAAAVGQVSGAAEGEVVRLREPVSFWGGVDENGAVSDVRHPDRGTSLAGRVLAMESGRGSSSSSSVLAELIHAGAGPAAVVTSAADPILVLGAVVPALLYGERVPVVVVSRETLGRLRTGDRVRVVAREREGWVEFL
ncbi:aconitase X swivel domain-containing protein [Amycolatopsis benzoatilytica]|uniref:aconitase X swivel domain-containing protein n=1 Tax=Amycolatopsis benzoatilytica TaxID=346045 RepID=UPI000361CF8B|nr:DUF126 domain-containing protein [Amycolatopsis benzoatilytica]